MAGIATPAAFGEGRTAFRFCRALEKMMFTYLGMVIIVSVMVVFGALALWYALSLWFYERNAGMGRT